MKTATKVQKQVHIIARVEIKKNGIVVYQVRSSNGTDIYQVTVVRGHVNNCTCPATKPCYHMVQLQERENARQISILANKAQERKARYVAAEASGEPIVEYSTMEVMNRDHGHYPTVRVNGGDWQVCRENGKPVQGFFTERQAEAYIEQAQHPQELGSCDTCGYAVKPGVTTCAKCLGF